MNHDKPLVSVIVPAYNAAKTIRRTLDSLRAQSWENLEVVVVDDGSTDGTAELAETVVREDNRFKVVRHGENLGTFQARLTGIQHSRGEYVAFVDADDSIAATAYATLTAKAVEADADIVIFGAYRIDLAGNKRIKVAFSAERLYESDLLERFARLEFGTGSMCNKLYRRSMLDEPRFEGVRRKLIRNEDYLCNISCFSRATRVLVLPDVFCHYSQTEGSQTSNCLGANAFVSLYENFADAVEVFNGADKRILRAIVQLYRHQLQMDYCQVHRREELEANRLRLGAAVERISRIAPEFVYEFFHCGSRPVVGPRAALRLLLAEVWRKCRCDRRQGANEFRG